MRLQPRHASLIDACRLLVDLAAAKPEQIGYRLSFAAAYDEIGHVQETQGDLVAALKSYRDALATGSASQNFLSQACSSWRSDGAVIPQGYLGCTDLPVIPRAAARPPRRSPASFFFASSSSAADRSRYR